MRGMRSNQFLTRVADDVLLNQPGMHTLRKALLRDAGAFYERFLVERSGEPALRVDVAEARRRLAQITAEVGSSAEADEEFRGAVASWEELLAAHPKDPHFQEELAATLSDWAAVLMRMEGRRDDAEAHCRRALGLARSSLDADPRSSSRRQLLGQVLQNTALIQFERGRPDPAIATLQEVLDVEGKLADEDPEALQPQIVLSHAACPDGVDPGAAGRWRRGWRRTRRRSRSSRPSRRTVPSWPSRPTGWRSPWAT